VGIIREWFDRNFTFRGVGAGIILALKLIPDFVGRTDFWSLHFRAVWQIVFAHSTMAVILGCAAFIWLDHRAVLKRREPTRINEKTLKGRTLKLADDMERFLAEMGTRPVWDRADIHSTTKIALWLIKLQSGFGLNFSERLKKLYWELGFDGVLPIVSSPKTEIENEDDLREVIDFLKKMAATIESKQP
jgi:hypothetical protein